MPASTPPRITLRYRVRITCMPDGLRRPRVLADRADPQAPAGPEQADVDDDERGRARQVDEEVLVEQDRPDDRDL